MIILYTKSCPEHWLYGSNNNDKARDTFHVNRSLGNVELYIPPDIISIPVEIVSDSD